MKKKTTLKWLILDQSEREREGMKRFYLIYF